MKEFNYATMKLALGLFLAAIVVVFTVQNVQAAPIRFLVWEMSVSLSLLIFGTLAAGIAAGWLVSSWLHWRTNRARKREIKAALK